MAGRRTLTAATCDLLASASALVIALTIDPTVTVGEEEAPPAATEPPPLEPTPLAVAPPNAPARPTLRDPFHVSVRVGGAADAGSLPGLGLGVGAAVAVGRMGWHVEAFGERWFSQTAASASGATATLDGLDAGVLGCVRRGDKVFVGGCAGVEVDHVRGVGRDVTKPAEDERVWIAPRLGVMLGVRPSHPIDVTLRVDAVAPLARPAFAIERVDASSAGPVRIEPIFRPAAVAGRASIAMTFNFF